MLNPDCLGRVLISCVEKCHFLCVKRILAYFFVRRRPFLTIILLTIQCLVSINLVPNLFVVPQLFICKLMCLCMPEDLTSNWDRIFRHVPSIQTQVMSPLPRTLEAGEGRGKRGFSATHWPWPQITALHQLSVIHSEPWWRGHRPSSRSCCSACLRNSLLGTERYSHVSEECPYAEVHGPAIQRVEEWQPTRHTDKPVH